MQFSFVSYCTKNLRFCWSFLRRYSVRNWLRQHFYRDNVLEEEGLIEEEIIYDSHDDHRPQPKIISLLPGFRETDENQGIQAKETVWNLFKLLEKKYSIIEYVVFEYVQCSDFTNETTVVFSTSGEDEDIEPHIIFLCRQFKQFGWKVILVSPTSLTRDDDLDCVDVILLRTCAGSHFTSWKAAFSALPSLFSCKEVILCNDSFFGGIGSFATVHQRMEDIACDFWGLTEHCDLIPFLESHYLVFRSPALQHQALSSFFESVPLSSNKNEENQCEKILTLWLARHGLCPAVYIPSQKYTVQKLSPCLEHWEKMIHWDVPLLSCDLFVKKELNIPLIGWMDLIEDKGYPVENVFSYINKRRIDSTIPLHANSYMSKWPPCVRSFYKPVPELDTTSKKQEHQSIDKIGVFIHMYYVDIAEEMLQYALNIPQHAQLFISTDSFEKKEIIQSACEEVGLVNRTEIQVFPNKGWDIAPFLVGFREALTQFDLLIHLHSKRSLHLQEKLGDAWRQLLYESIVGSKEHVNKIIDLFSHNERLGLVCPPILPKYATSLNAGVNFSFMKELLSAYDVFLESDTPIDFPVGSMFWCRPRVLQPWLDQQFTFDQFGQTVSSERDGTLAHALERLFFFGCALEGYSWTRIVPSPITMK